MTYEIAYLKVHGSWKIFFSAHLGSFIFKWENKTRALETYKLFMQIPFRKQVQNVAVKVSSTQTRESKFCFLTQNIGLPNCANLKCDFLSRTACVKHFKYFFSFYEGIGSCFRMQDTESFSRKLRWHHCRIAHMTMMTMSPTPILAPDLEILISPYRVSRGGSDATGREKEVFISRERLAPPLRGQEQGGGLLEIGLVLSARFH